MEHYTLQPDEAALYRNEVRVRYEGKDQPCTLLLTDKFFVFIVKQKKFLRKEDVTVESFATNTVKIYKDSPNILRKGNKVDIYFIGGERSIAFPNKGEAKKFVALVTSFITGKSTLIRGIEKTKKTVADVGGSIGIDKDVALGVAQVGAELLLNKSAGNKKLTTTEKIKTASGIFHRKETKQLPPMSPQEQADALERLKGLLDNGVITQEEFDLKKKEYLGL